MAVSGEKTLLEQNRWTLKQSVYPQDVIDRYCTALESLFDELKAGRDPEPTAHGLPTELVKNSCGNDKKLLKRALITNFFRTFAAMNDKKLIIFSAPSGSGKSTIINWLMAEHPELSLAFSISCTSRKPRGTEQNGVEYFFLSPEEFRQRIANNEFLEYEEVYEDRFYGTLKSQVERQLEAGQNVVFDVDVKGGCAIKKFYDDRALSVFIQPPSIEALRLRLEGRGTDAPEVIEQRLQRAEFELSFADKFDRVVVNDDLKTAEEETFHIISDFLTSNSSLGFAAFTKASAD